MELIYYAADFATGDLYPQELPLRGVELSSSLEVGELSATLDLREMVDEGDYRGSWEVIKLIQAGASTIVPVRAGITAPTGDVSIAMGEWWITRVVRSQSSPIVHIHGVELTGYLAHTLAMHNVKGTFDPMAKAAEQIGRAFTVDQPIPVAVDVGSWSSSMSVQVDLDAAQQSYLDVVQALQGERLFEWTIATSLEMDGDVPVRVQRTVQMGAPALRIERLDVAVEATPEGVAPAAVLDVSVVSDVSTRASDLYLWGAGHGAAQLRARARMDLPSRWPRLGRSSSAVGITSAAVLNTEAWRLWFRTYDPVFQPFTVEALMDLLPGGGPRVGHVYPWIKAESLAVPEAVADTADARVRVLEWSWQQPSPGARETATLKLVRE